MSNRTIHVGAQVRFLNAVGGGRVTRLTRDTAWVEDTDGFEIPTPISECVVVDEGDTFMPAYKPPKLSSMAGTGFDKGAVEAKTKMQGMPFDAPAHEASEPKVLGIPKSYGYLPATGEINLSMAILPTDYAHLGKTNYEIYLVNDSRYSLYYVVSTKEGLKNQLRAHGMAEPDSVLFVGEVFPNELNDWQEIHVHAIAYADNPGVYKATYSLEARLNLPRLFKRHSFVPTDFFDDDALLIALVDDGKPLGRELSIDARHMEQAMYLGQKPAPDRQIAPSSRRGVQSQDCDPLVIDLHIEELLPSTVGMNNADILRYQIDKFNQVMQDNLRNKGRKIIFIHGKGEGVLRNKLIGELRYRYKQCRWQDASFLEYSYGATQVTIA